MSKHIAKQVESALRDAMKQFIGKAPANEDTIKAVKETLQKQLASLAESGKIRIVPRFELRHPSVFNKATNGWEENKAAVEVVWNEADLVKAGLRDED